jgi:predicted RNA-binding protein with PIN domain
MSMHLIVDGYNLARSGAMFLSEDPAGAEGRGELCTLLSGYARKKRMRLTVVFDGRGGPSPERTRQGFARNPLGTRRHSGFLRGVR